MLRINRNNAGYKLLIATAICAFLSLSSPGQGARGAANPFSKGDSDAPFQIEVFYDFQCPSCAVFHKTLMEVAEKHGDKIRITIRHFPLSVHDKAFDAAIAVEAAGDQGKFWEMAGLLLTNQSKWSNSKNYREIFARYAKSLDLDVERFSEFTVQSVNGARINSDIQRARSLELGSLPSVILNGRLLTFVESTELEEIISRGN